jgi:hypothetical protein
MSTETANTSFPPELLAEMEEAARIALSNVRDPEVMRQASARMDRMREENRKRFGIQDVAVDLIRQVRDEA